MDSKSQIFWKDLKTGLLFVFGLALFAILAAVIGKNTSVLTGVKDVYIFVEDVQSLAENNFVAVAGKKVGTVSTMTFTTRNDTPGVVVRLNIKQEFADLVTKDSKAIIKSLGVLGDKYVDITPGHGEIAQNGDFIAVVHKASIDQLSDVAMSTLSNLNETLEKINKGEGTLGKLVNSAELIDRITQTATNLEIATARLYQGNGLMAKLISDDKLPKKLESLIDNLNAISVALNSGEGTLGKLLMDDTFYNNLNHVSVKAESLISKLENPNGTVGKLTSDPELYNNLNRTVSRLDSLITDMKQNPSRYVKLSIF